MRFADLADGGRRLALLLTPDVVGDAVVVCIGEGGQVTGRAVAEVPVATTRTDDGVLVDLSSVDVAGRSVVVVDDGVESGAAALAAGAAIRGAGATHVVLAVPVCPVDAEEGLRVRYDDVIAVTKPQERRTLRWHYETFA
jgi:predicted phosphoribosyltransferase